MLEGETRAHMEGDAPEASGASEQACPSRAASPVLSRRNFVTALAGAASLVAVGNLSGCSKDEEEEVVEVINDRGYVSAEATLSMVGDVLIHERVYNTGLQSDGTYNFDHLFAQMADDFAAPDISIVNQETILGGTELGLSGYPLFNSPQEVGDAEVAVGVDVAAAATNHALDQGFDGIEAECVYWRENHPEVTCLGIADSEEVADTVHILECNGISVALLNDTESTNGISLPSDASWCVKLLDEDEVSADVATAREQGADVVVVLPHWGTEYASSPDSSQEAWAQNFLDLGVDVVIGTHSHVLQPVEVLEGDDGHRMLVFWSLGNFTSTMAYRKCMVGGMANVTFQKSEGEVSVGSWSLTGVVTHRASGTDFTTYRLADYTDDLAAENLISEDESGFTVSWCKEWCADVLGDDFDEETCVLSGTV